MLLRARPCPGSMTIIAPSLSLSALRAPLRALELTLPRRKASAAEAALSYQQKPRSGTRAGRYIVAPTHFQYDPLLDERKQHEVSIRNGRMLSPTPTLGTDGFTLVRSPTACADFTNDREVLSTYYSELGDLARETLGGSCALVFDHVLRCAGDSTAGEDGNASAVTRVHCDLTEWSAASLLEEICERGIYSRSLGRLLKPAELSRLAKGRHAFVNIWRNVADTPIQRLPLAVCRASSTDARDRFPYEIMQPMLAGDSRDNYALDFRAEHEWCYFPDMVKDECLMFKTFDSSQSEARFVFHAAFDDPSTPENAPPRESIEVRAIVFFDSEVTHDKVLHMKMKLKNGRVVGKLTPHE
eukprot:TRINITY_DN33488_c0_g1_i1.p1 TRINITY_DN33488_c0_g1~~TRINITY_DN33488_c0_g1_i1.p1  ORF type:complete len:356 (+),score=41.95 TRINITY_DN33488_c0_g1_i1:36-1103(+)